MPSIPPHLRHQSVPSFAFFLSCDIHRLCFLCSKIMAVPTVSDLDPTIFLAAGDHPEKSANPPDLLILNQPITDFATFSRLWAHTDYRICADGGANRLHDMFQGDLVKQRACYVSLQFLSIQDTREVDLNSFRVSSTVILTLCATMYVHTTSHTVLKCYETVISTAQILGRRCQRSRHETTQGQRKTC